MMRYAYRVTYKRHGWTHTQSRQFTQRARATRFVDKLRTGAPHLAPLVVLTLDRRPVGDWEEVVV